MLGFVKKNILASKQRAIKRRFSNLQVTLHPDMSVSSMSKMVEISRLVEEVNAFEGTLQGLSDEALRQKTQEFKAHLQKKSKQYEQEIEALKEMSASLTIPEEKDKISEKIKRTRNKIFEEILPQAFAVVREAAKRAIGMRHFDVQIAGGIILHEGKIAEMATGEGKTLVATLPAYLNALLGKGVHIVTVNDYLARRDREWMGPVYEFLGLSVGVIQHEMSDAQRKLAYGCDIAYGTNNEFGFDYLRDNMKYAMSDVVQREFFFAIVDEVDSILIDEARTPLIISGPSEESTEKYYSARKICDQFKGKRVADDEPIDKFSSLDLNKGFDYVANEKAQTVALTDEGELKAARLWGIDNLHSIDTIEYRHHTIQALRAKEFFRLDVEYVIKDGQVIIVDDFTGRLMPGRRWSDGLHQAVEAKEGLKIEHENQTLATITFQNYFRMYEKLSGMTGTAYTEASEFKAIYRLDVVTIPTNRQLIRSNFPDCIYKTEKEKYSAVVEEIAELFAAGEPVLVGTISIDKSERLSEMLKRRGVPHQVLNAKYHEMEAAIVAQAGRFKAVTIATNMAGRGTDILLGGNADFMAKNLAKQQLSADDPAFAQEYKQLLERYRKESAQEHDRVVKVGGLHVLGTERHEARRIDNQLRGRSGRQGDPGSSRFYVALEDDLMRLFGSDKLMGIMDKLGFEEGQVIEHPWVSRSIEIAQRRLEQHNFEIRKQLLEYDNVMNKQREVIYGQRRQILEGISLEDHISGIIEKIVEVMVSSHFGENVDFDQGFLALQEEALLRFGIALEQFDMKEKSNDAIKKALVARLTFSYNEKEKSMEENLLRHLERMVFLQIIDSKWKDHLYAMDKLREGIGLRAYGQRDPLIEYKREAFESFSQMVDSIETEAVETIFKVQPAKQQRFKGVFSSLEQELLHPELAMPETKSDLSSATPAAMPAGKNPSVAPSQPKVGRNDPCPCGSGKKYKKCCGQ